MPELEGSRCLGAGDGATVVGQFGERLRLLSHKLSPLEARHGAHQVLNASLLELAPPGSARGTGWRCTDVGDAELRGLPLRQPDGSLSPCLKEGQPPMGTIAIRFLRLRSGRYLGFWAGPHVSSTPTSCGFAPKDGPAVLPQCCQAGHFLESVDGRRWEYQGSFTGVHEWPLASWGQACTSSPSECGVQTSAAGEANTAVELADGRIMTVYRQSSCGLPLLKAFSSNGSAKSWGAGSPTLASATRQGIGTVRGDVLRMSNGRLVMVAGRPGLGLWVATDESADEWESINVAMAFNRLQTDPTQHFSAAFASASVNATA
eukprot:SAG11_NODE_4110_length_2061_cov_1.357288_2_plen_317_part_01